MRKLASVRRIAAIEPIENADQIEKAIVDGWEVVVKKSEEYKPGDQCVYIEIDSEVPKIEYFEFLEPRRYRVRTIKLRKQVSQGLIIPLNDINVIREQLGITDRSKQIMLMHLDDSTDLTDDLGITKYDTQAKEEKCLNESKTQNPAHKYLLRYKWYRKLWKKKKAWPEKVLKTDEERIQNCSSILWRESDRAFYESEKLDGQSCTFFNLSMPWFWKISKRTFGVCSRNIWLKTPNNSNYWQIAKKYKVKEKLKKYKHELIIQGEIIGPGIQKNKYGLKGLDFYVFNVYNASTDEWYGRHGIEAVCDKLDLKMVPIVAQDKLSNLGTTVPEFVERVKGNSTLAKVKREGSVFRELCSVTGKRGISFKVINPNFLLKYEC